MKTKHRQRHKAVSQKSSTQSYSLVYYFFDTQYTILYNDHTMPAETFYFKHISSSLNDKFNEMTFKIHIHDNVTHSTYNIGETINYCYTSDRNVRL